MTRSIKQPLGLDLRKRDVAVAVALQQDFLNLLGQRAIHAGAVVA